jgi:hypothetical protein
VDHGTASNGAIPTISNHHFPEHGADERLAVGHAAQRRASPKGCHLACKRENAVTKQQNRCVRFAQSVRCEAFETPWKNEILR